MSLKKRQRHERPLDGQNWRVRMGDFKGKPAKNGKKSLTRKAASSRIVRTFVHFQEKTQ